MKTYCTRDEIKRARGAGSIDLPSVVVFAAALLVRLVVLAVNLGHASPYVETPDSRGYLLTAESLWKHGTSLDLQGNEADARVPGYPWFLALTFFTRLATPDRLAGTLLAQCLLGSLTAVLAARVADRVAGRASALVAGLLVALEPSSVAYSGLIMSETVYAFAVALTVLMAASWLRRPEAYRLGLLALLIGLLPFVRPVALFLALPVTLFVLFGSPLREHRRRRALLFLVLALLMPGCWCLRNTYRFGFLRFDRTGPLVKAVFARSVEESLGLPVPPGPWKHPWETHFGEDQGLTSREAMRRQDLYFRETVEDHPLAAARRCLLTTIQMAGVPATYLDLQLLGHPTPFAQTSVLGRMRWLVHLGPLGAYLALGMMLSLASFTLVPWAVRESSVDSGSRSALLALIVLLIVYHWGLFSVQWQQADRGRLPIVPLLAVNVAVFIRHVRSKRQESPERNFGA